MNRINKQQVIESLKELSDRELQERLWTSTGYPEVSSFTEAVEQLFTDSGLGRALEVENTELNDKATALLCQIREQLRAIDGMRDPKAIINDPRMIQIRQLSSATLKLL
jgi:transcription initiation factor IIE alpha subunit